MPTESTHTTAVYERLRRDIISGNLPADAKLKTRELAARFDVGLSPVREALSRLLSEGWVRQADRRGFSVVPATVDVLWDLHRARCLLNEVGLRESIAYGGVDWEEGVLLAYHRMSRQSRPSGLCATDEVEHWTALHRAFHTSLVCGARTHRLVQYCEQLFDEIERYRRIGVKFGAAREAVGDEHRAIADAAIARDNDLAQRLLNDHYTRTVEHVDLAIRSNRPGAG